MKSVLWKYIKLISLFSFCFCLFSNCNHKKRNIVEEQTVSSLLSHEDIDGLKGKQVHSLDSVVEEIL